MFKFFKDYIDSINEGLIKIYKGDIVIEQILSSLKSMNLNVSGEYSKNKLILTLFNFNTIPLNKIEHIFDQITTIVINQGGWFPSTMKLNKLTNITKSDRFDFYKIININDELESVTIIFESKFDDIDYDIPNKLYHLSIKEYDKKK